MEQREIKFRAVYDNSVYEVTEIMWSDRTVYITRSRSGGDFEELVSLDDVELLQYTGLKDKNGREIWEGDLILLYGRQDWNKDERPLAVLWDGHISGFGFKGQDMATHLNFRKLAAEHYEVIGNVFNNPELLK